MVHNPKTCDQYMKIVIKFENTIVLKPDLIQWVDP